MKPNVLLLLPDQWRGDWWSGSGHGLPLETPMLSRMAAAGAAFDAAYSPSPLCAPARACLAAGRRYDRCGVASNRDNFPAGSPTVYRALRDSGYHVMGCGKFDLHKPDYVWGVDGRGQIEAWGFSDGIDNEGKIDGVEAYKRGQPGPYLTFLTGLGVAGTHTADFAARGDFGTFPTPLSGDEYCDNWIVGNAELLLDRAPRGKPWFLQVNFTGPHFPYDVTAEMAEWFAGVDFPEPYDARPVSGADHAQLRRNYAAMIRNIDAGIGRLLNHPRVRAERADTVVVFSSDHGEMLGDRGRYGKCLPYNGSLHVPLILNGPGIPSGIRIGAPVSLTDLSATILELCGAPALPGMDSVSLVRSMIGNDGKRRPVASALRIPEVPDHSWRAAIDERWKYVRWDDGREVLYERSDYSESRDVLADHRDEARRLRGIAEEPAS